MTEMIRCREAVRQLWEYLDQGLDEHDHQAVEQHLSYCMRCCGELEFARELRRLLHTASATEPPQEVRDRLETFIDLL